MDDRDFIYWLYGLLEFTSFDVFREEHINTIIENIICVHDSIQQRGAINDLEAFRIISFIEGSLMYYSGAPSLYQEKIYRLIKNEVTDLYYQYQEEEPKNPYFKYELVSKLNDNKLSISESPLPGKDIKYDLSKNKALNDVKIKTYDLSQNDALNFLDSFTKLFKEMDQKEKDDEKTNEDQGIFDFVVNEIDSMFDEQSEEDNNMIGDESMTEGELESSLDAIVADKIAR